MGLSEAKKSTEAISLVREQQLVKLLMAYLCSGLFFLILPGTFLGVWNLFSISSSQSATSIPINWIQAHGHAQLFGWIGSFILGIGFYSIPNLRRVSAWSFWEGWLTLILWTSGVLLRWLSTIYLYNWQILVPLSALLEFLAVLFFLARSVQGHRRQAKQKHKLEAWALLVIGGTIGLLVTTAFNLFECVRLSFNGTSPIFPPDFNSMFLILSIWGFILPIAWGFTAHWMPIFLGLKTLQNKMLLLSFALNAVGVLTTCAHRWIISAIILLISAILMVLALRIFEPPAKEVKTQGVHQSFPTFIRIAYIWLLIAAILALWAALHPQSPGIGGAGRHAITVGFLMTMVFSVAPRMLPAFLGRKELFSKKLMFIALALTNTGCLIRVSSEIIAYQYDISWAWILLPISATLELTGVIIFAINMLKTFQQPPLLPVKKQI